MRKLLVGALVGAVALAMGAIAVAATRTTYRQSYSSNKVGRSVGVRFETTSIDPDNQANNQQPSAIREMDITFPGGTKIDQSTKPFCAEVDESKNDPCPKGTQVGSGSAEVRLRFAGTDPITAHVIAYNRKRGLWLYIVPDAAGQAPIVLKSTFHGLVLVTKFPPLCVANDCRTNGEAVFTKLTLNTNAFERGVKAYMISPAECSESGWTFDVDFTYAPPTPPRRFSSVQPCDGSSRPELPPLRLHLIVGPGIRTAHGTPLDRLEVERKTKNGRPAGPSPRGAQIVVHCKRGCASRILKMSGNTARIRYLEGRPLRRGTGFTVRVTRGRPRALGPQWTVRLNSRGLFVVSKPKYVSG